MSERNQAEEQTLPATPKKLREARRKGQTAHSRDMVTATLTLAGLLYLWLGWDRHVARLRQLLSPPDELYRLPFDQALGPLLGQVLELAVLVVAPLLALLLLVSVVTNIAVTGGPVLAIDPVLPKAERLNPASGLKRIFSLKNLIEVLKSLLKVSLIVACAIGLGLLGLKALIQGPSCGLGCIGTAFGSLVQPLLIAIILVFLLFALFDLGVQRWLFRREMRMTKTEFRRERRDLEGDPAIRQVRRRRRRELVDTGGVPLGLAHASLLLVDRTDNAVGLRYVRGETPVPVVVCKGRADRAFALIGEARQLRIAVLEEPALAEALMRGGGLGEFVPQGLFHQVAAALIRAGVA